MDGSSKKEIPAAIYPLVALAIAIILWFAWVEWGVAYAHKRISSYAAGYARAALVSSPKNPAVDSQQVTSSVPIAEPDRAATMSEIGQSGDAFGGANALFAALAGALVLWAGIVQNQALKEAKLATGLATAAYDNQRDANRRDQFSTTFFQMLTLSRQLVERIDVPKRVRLLADSAGQESESQGQRKQGAAALESLAWHLVRRLNQSGNLPEPDQQASVIVTTYLGIFEEAPSSLGPYFRLLFQTFKFVAEAEFLDEAEKIRFANIARGQMSEGAVMLLAANGLSERGHQFIPLIERFGLLEHLHNAYRNKYKPALLSGYRPRAFMGSKERSKSPFFNEPLHAAHHFTTWPEAMESEKASR